MTPPDQEIPEAREAKRHRPAGDNLFAENLLAGRQTIGATMDGARAFTTYAPRVRLPSSSTSSRNTNIIGRQIEQSLSCPLKKRIRRTQKWKL